MLKTVVIIPAYNEEACIAGVLADLQDLGRGMPIQVVLVDDGSTDQTLVQAKRFLECLDLKIISHQVNQGVPRTFYDGFAYAAELAGAEDCLVLIEGDGTSDLKILPAMASAIRQGSDVVIASRQIRGGRYRNFPLYRTCGSSLVNLVLKTGLRIPGVTDYTIFYRAYRAGLIQRALAEYGSGFITGVSFAANVEVLLRVQRYATRISEIPYEYDYSCKKSASKMQLGKTLIECQRLIARRWTREI